MESHVDGGGRGRGRRSRSSGCPFELRPAPRPLLEVRGDHLRVDWTQNVYRRALERGIEIHLPRYQPRSTLTLCRVPVGRRAGAPARASSTRSTRRSSARARTSPPTREIARAAERAGLDPDGAIEAAYSPERCAQIAGDPRARPRPPACAACRRCSPRAASATGAWAARAAARRRAARPHSLSRDHLPRNKGVPDRLRPPCTPCSYQPWSRRDEQVGGSGRPAVSSETTKR